MPVKRWQRPRWKVKRQYQRKKKLQKNLRSMRMKLMHPIKKIKAKKIRQMTEVNLQFNQEEKWVQQNNRMKKLSIWRWMTDRLRIRRRCWTFWINTMRKQRFLLQEPCRNIKIWSKRLMIRDIRSECIHILMITQRCMHLLMHIFRILTRLDSL